MKYSTVWRRCSVTDPRELLRRYLEQRRELGEREFVLDSLSVEEAMRILGARSATGSVARGEGGPSAAARDMSDVSDVSDVSGGNNAVDWREALRAAGAAPSAPPTAVPPTTSTPVNRGETAPAASLPGIPASTPEIAGQVAPLGISVGGSSHELFGAGGPGLDSLETLEKAIATCTRCPL